MFEKTRLTLLGVCLGLAACDSARSRDLTAPDTEPEAFDPSAAALANSWATKAPIPVAVTFAAAGAISNIIYVVGGSDAANNSIKTVRAYNTTFNFWSTRADLPGNRSSPNGASNISGRLYVSGGKNNTTGATKSLYRYDPGTNTWLARANMPVPSACGAQGVISGLLYVYAPGLGACGPTHGFYRYNPATNTWISRAVPPSKHSSPVAGVIGGKFYLAGGTLNGSLDPNLALHVYTPASNSWATKAPLPSKQQHAAGGALLGKLYVAGGVNFTAPGVPPIGTNRAYDPATNSWATKAPMLTPRFYTAGTNAGGLLWVISGFATTTTGRSTKNEAYTP